MKRRPELTVHAELPIYPNPGARADLTIHRIGNDNYWATQKRLMASLEYAIEIKYANIRNPHYDFNTGGVENDIARLKSLKKDVKKYLIIVDEAEKIDPIVVGKFVKKAIENGITILSNNTRLMHIF